MIGGTYGADRGRCLGRRILFELQRLLGCGFVNRLIFRFRRSGDEHRSRLGRRTRPLRQAGAVHAEGPRERCDRGQQALLETHERQPPVRRLRRRRSGETLGPHLTIPREHLRQDQFRGIRRQSAKVDRLYNTHRELLAQQP